MKNIIMHHPLCSPKYLVVFLTAQPKDKRHLDCSMTGKQVNNREKQVHNHPKNPLQSLNQLKPRTPILILHQQIEMREMFKNKLAKKKELCFYTFILWRVKEVQGHTSPHGVIHGENFETKEPLYISSWGSYLLNTLNLIKWQLVWKCRCFTLLE